MSRFVIRKDLIIYGSKQHDIILYPNPAYRPKVTYLIFQVRCFFPSDPQCYSGVGILDKCIIIVVDFFLYDYFKKTVTL